MPEVCTIRKSIGCDSAQIQIPNTVAVIVMEIEHKLVADVGDLGMVLNGLEIVAQVQVQISM